MPQRLRVDIAWREARFDVGLDKASPTYALIATNKGSRWFFVYGFEKNEQTNIADDELEALQDMAKRQ